MSLMPNKPARRHTLIKTSHIYPPIPTRQFDWCAWYDRDGGETGKDGYGRTEQEAIDDLKANYDEPSDSELENDR